MKLTHRSIFVTLLCHVITRTAAKGGFNRQQEEGHLVIDSQQFHDAMINKSRRIVYLDSDVELRNYYGWDFSRNRQERPPPLENMIEVSAYPLRYSHEGRPKIDLDGHSLHQILSGRQTLISKRMHYLRAHLPVDPERSAIQETHVELNDCVIEVFIEEHGPTIRRNVKYLRSVMEDPSALPYATGSRVTDWWCDRNEGIRCPNGALIFYNTTIPWTKNYTWHLTNTIIKFVHRKEARVGLSKAFSMAIENENDNIAIPYSMALDFKICKKKPVVVNTTIYGMNRSIPPIIVLNFQERLYGCVPVAGIPVIRVTDLILRNIFSSDEWPVIFPFIDAPERATVVLENVIIEMDTSHGFGTKDLYKMVRGLRSRTRPDGLGNGPQEIDVWKAEDCRSRLTQFESCRLRKCPKEAECPSSAIFIEDASFLIEKGDGNGDLAIGVRYHVRQCLITVIPPPAGVVNGTNSTSRVEFGEDHPGTALPVTQHSSAKEALLVTAIVIIGIMCALLAICGYTTYRYGLFERWSGAKSDRSSGSATAQIAEKFGLHEVRTFLTPEIPTHPLAAHNTDIYQTYQQAASRLLGSVTLGSLLGAGSFGKVFKATWNGATVAVKVIVHDGLSYRGTSAQREALLSSNLHHPNIVQTFVQTTREIKQDEHIPTVSQPHPAIQTAASPPVQPAPVPETTGDDGGGYLNLAEMVPNEYRPEPPPKSMSSSLDLTSTGRSFSTDRVETWLVQEYCDMGSLDKAIRKGKFVKRQQLNMVLVVETCVDICRGMLYLKNRNIIHGDLKSSNILLNGSLHEGKRFVAKVADFGLSRELGMHATHVSTQTTGTVTHMPPELFREERLTAASDVYSFGIVMWELVSKESPLEGVPHFLIIKKIIYDSWRPTFVEGIPECYMALARRCWAEDPQQRPMIDRVLDELEYMRQHFLQAESRV